MNVSRVLLVSKALVVGAYQRKAELLATQPDIDLTVAVPSAWHGAGQQQRLERIHVTGYELVETPIRFSGSFHLHHFPRLGELLDARLPGLMHMDEEPYNLSTWLALRDAKARGIRTIFFAWQNLDRALPPPFARLQADVFRDADGAIAGTPAAAELLRHRGWQGPMWIIPQFGVDPLLYQPPPGGRDASPGQLRVGYAGRLVKAKGVDLLIEALHGLPGGVSLEIAGDGPERRSLVRLAERLRVAHRVSFLGHVPSSAMDEFYRRLDVIVLPSRTTERWAEQFGRVLIEAMACGVVCIGSATGEIPHVLGDAGLLFPEGDVPALRGHIGHMVADPGLRDELAQRGMAHVREQFTMAKIAADTAAAWRSVLER